MKTLKTIFRIVLCTFAVMLLFIVLLLSCIATIPFSPRDYTKKTVTGGELEKRYLAIGAHAINTLSVKMEKPVRRISCYYPEELSTEECQWPVVLFLNGTGGSAAKYQSLFHHLASWGFIVLSNDDHDTGTGKSADLTLDWLLKEHEREGSVFYRKVDVRHIGIFGHSQGGAGVFNAVTVQPRSDQYKVAVALSPTHEELAAAVKFPYDITKVHIPTMIVAGTVSDFETKLVIPLDKMQKMYSQLPAPKVMMRKKNCDHGQSLYLADGYVTAWLLWHLKGDAEAALAFIGEQPELPRNSLYIDTQIDTNDNSKNNDNY